MATGARRWRIAQGDGGGLPIVERLLRSRGVEGDEYHRFMNPELGQLHDPWEMADMQRAVSVICQALEADEPIVVYGDYDADGLTSTSLLLRLFSFLGHPASFYIPQREGEGYGMTVDALQRLAARGMRLVVTVDNGVTCLEQIAAANSMGMRVVVTDHHLPGERLPDAEAVVNPHRADCRYPFKELAGVGVAFKLAHGILRKMGVAGADAKPFLASCIPLTAIGTVGDIVPLTGENRVIVANGLRMMSSTSNLGIRALRSVAAGDEQGWKAPCASSEVAFQIVPRLNAAGRMQQAAPCVELLTTDDWTTAVNIARWLGELNDQRKQLEERAVEECSRLLGEAPGDRVLVVDAKCHAGVAGIVASRLVEIYGRPTIVVSVAGDNAVGSGRSVPGFDLHAALNACSGLMRGFGGHQMAAGLNMEARGLNNLRAALNEYAAGCAQLDSGRELHIDQLLAPDECTLQLADALTFLEPYGAGNSRPVFAMRGLRLCSDPRVVGSNHLKMQVAVDGWKFSAMWFKRANQRDRLMRMPSFSMAFELMADEWQGERQLTLRVVDIQ